MKPEFEQIANANSVVRGINQPMYFDITDYWTEPTRLKSNEDH